MKKRREGYEGYLCDPKKATTCKKTRCYYTTGDVNGCRYTTKREWRKDDDTEGSAVQIRRESMEQNHQ